MKFATLAALALAVIAIAGCENDDHSPRNWNKSAPQSSESKNVSDSSEPAETRTVSGDIIGTWQLSDGGTPWYAHFASDGTWKITNDKEGNELRVYGNYTFSGDSFKGDMKNPGVGDGEISGTIARDIMSMDFVEHWHTPYKHVGFVGPKL